MTEKERMLSGKLYMATDSELGKDSAKGRKLIRLFNQTTEEQGRYRIELLKDLFEKTGEKLYIEPPFHCDYGCNIMIGENFYANYDCIIIDVCKVKKGKTKYLWPFV